jgi:hypothetical protein
MLVATFGESTGWAGKTISHEAGQFLLEDFGPIPAQALLDYDGKGQLVWAYAGLREWVQQVEQGHRAALSPDASVSLTGEPRPEQPIVGFVLSLVGIALPIAWLAGIVVSWLDLRRAKRENLPHGFALAGLIISCIGTALSLVGILIAALTIPLLIHQSETMFLDQSSDRVDESAAIRESVHSIQVGVESWAIDHGDAYPAATRVSESGLASYVDVWPTNPYTGLPMAQGTAPGDFTYTVTPDRRSFRMTALGEDGQPLIVVP